MENKFFIAIYTNAVKKYCDSKFFQRVLELSKGNPVHVVDNTIGNEYVEELAAMFERYDNFHLYHLEVDEQPKRTQFLRNVAESADFLKERFLESDSHYFLILESDVLPPTNLLWKLENSINAVNSKDENWGAIGGLYYEGFHDYNKTGIQKTHHVLSGCTVYKREALERFPFRWSEENLGAFSDAWWSHDAGKEYGLYNDHDIICRHLANPANGTRYSKLL